jgi:hypothetical protein
MASTLEQSWISRWEKRFASRLPLRFAMVSRGGAVALFFYGRYQLWKMIGGILLFPGVVMLSIDISKPVTIAGLLLLVTSITPLFVSLRSWGLFRRTWISNTGEYVPLLGVRSRR